MQIGGLHTSVADMKRHLLLTRKRRSVNLFEQMSSEEEEDAVLLLNKYCKRILDPLKLEK